MTYAFDNLLLDICTPRRIVAFGSVEGVNGSYTINPFNIKTVGLCMDGVSVPGLPLEADAIEAYMHVNLFEGTNTCTWREDK